MESNSNDDGHCLNGEKISHITYMFCWIKNSFVNIIDGYTIYAELVMTLIAMPSHEKQCLNWTIFFLVTNIYSLC